MFYEKESPVETRIREEVPNHNIHDSYDRKPLNENRDTPNQSDRKSRQ